MSDVNDTANPACGHCGHSADSHIPNWGCMACSCPRPDLTRPREDFLLSTEDYAAGGTAVADDHPDPS